MIKSAAKPLVRKDFIAVFEEIGLTSGDNLIVHSACRMLGSVEGGADTIIDALLEIIGSTGNLMFPTFNYTRPLPDPYFDPAETPARTGILSELGRRREVALRSLHPTHSVAVIGPDAVSLTMEHNRCRAFGISSPIDRLARMRGKILLLGVGHTSNTTIHVAEEYAGIPKVSIYDDLPLVKVRAPDGTMFDVRLDTSTSCSVAFGAAESVLREHNVIRDAKLARCNMQLMSGESVISLLRDLLREKPGCLLCNSGNCPSCTGVRSALKLKNHDKRKEINE